MASYHWSIKSGKKGGANRHARYIARDGSFGSHGRSEDLVAKGSGNLPPWAEGNASSFWSAADQYEGSNAAVFFVKSKWRSRSNIRRRSKSNSLRLTSKRQLARRPTNSRSTRPSHPLATAHNRMRTSCFRIDSRMRLSASPRSTSAL